MSRTSESDPILVDFIDPSLLPGGKLGLTFAPGKVQSNPRSGTAWDRDVRIDLRRLRSHYGADIIVGLIEEHEFEELEITHLPDTAAALSIEYRRFPIRDYGTPDDRVGFDELVDELVDELESQKTIVLHCKGGLGRAGTLAGSILVRLGVDPSAAIDAVRVARIHAIENRQQEQFVKSIEPR